MSRMNIEEKKRGGARGWLLRSADRLVVPGNAANSTSSNFTLQFQQTLPPATYEVMWITVPNTTYNVDNGKDSLSFETVSSGGGIQNTTSLENNNYTATELATALSAIPYFDTITTTNYNLTWTYDPATFRFTVTNGAPQTGYLHYAPSSILRTLGFGPPPGDEPLPLELPPGVPIVAPFVAQLGNPLSIAITIPEATAEGFVTAGSVYRSDRNVGGQIIGSTRSTNIVQADLIVPLLSASGSYSYITKENFPQFFTLRGSRSQITFELRDPDTKNILDLHGGEWEMFVRQI